MQEAFLDESEHICNLNGTRLTEKRRNILSLLKSCEKSLSAYELVDAYREHYEVELPAMSVYRILEFLEQSRLVRKVELTNKYIACCYLGEHSESTFTQVLVCERCSLVKEIFVDKQAFAIIKKYSDQAGFNINTEKLEIQGVCDKCTGK